MNFKISLQNISKKFQQNILFKNINEEIISGEKIALLGSNGSGKSTLLQIIAGYISPSSGNIFHYINNKIVEEENWYKHISIAAPYIDPPDELTVEEIIYFHFTLKKCIAEFDTKNIAEFIQLSSAKNKLFKKLSSGMKQRLRLGLAFFTQCEIILLDEPCTNLDAAGIELYNELLIKFSKDNTIIVASNDEKEYSFCERKISVMLSN